MTETKIRYKEEGAFPINEELAGLVPMAVESEQVVLTEDIKANQQRDPIVLWKGKVIDGRCRMKALIALGHNILYKELDSKLTVEEVEVFVKSVNTRRNLTPTQKTMSACRASLKPNSPKVLTVAKSWGVSAGLLKNARFISKHRPEFIEPLFNGLSVDIISAEGFEVQSNKVSTIYAAVMREMQDAKENEEHAWSEDSSIKTQIGKEWYYGFVSKHKIEDVATRVALVELANYKFIKGKVYNEVTAEDGIEEFDIDTYKHTVTPIREHTQEEIDAILMR